MSDNGGFAKLVPGFEFLQNLAKGAGASMPGVGHWIAPTLDPAELDKRIEELRTVKFWLEQNGRLLDTTIQALEVQRMTLATLQTMNVQMSDLREAMTIRTPPPAPRPEPEPEARPVYAPEAPVPPETASEADAKAAGSPPSGAPTIDPMQWWGALTKQFTSLATAALQKSGAPSSPDTAPPPPAAKRAPRAPGARTATEPRRTVKPLAASPAKDSPLPRKKPVRKTPGR